MEPSNACLSREGKGARGVCKEKEKIIKKTIDNNIIICYNNNVINKERDD